MKLKLLFMLAISALSMATRRKKTPLAAANPWTNFLEDLKSRPTPENMRAAMTVSIVIHTRRRCSGVLIDVNMVLTTSRCVAYLVMDDITVRIGVGEPRAGYRISTGIVSHVWDIIYHPEAPATDVAILILTLPALEAEPRGRKERSGRIGWVAHARLAAEGYDPPEGLQVSTMNWLRTSPPSLKSYQLSVISQKVCSEQLGRIVAQDEFCLDKQSTHDYSSCRTNSGHPVFDQNLELIGISVYVDTKCVKYDKPVVYTSIGAIVDWIDSLRRRPELSMPTTPGDIPVERDGAEQDHVSVRNARI